MRHLILILVLANFLSWVIIFQILTFQEEVSFLAVGEGQSILIKTRPATIVIDAGPPTFKGTIAINNHLPWFDKVIDLLIISHPDIDHFGGAFWLLKNYRIRAILTNGYDSLESGWQKFLKLAMKKKIPLIVLSQNDKILIDPYSFFVFHPPRNYHFKNDNQASLVIKFQTPSLSVLTTGDIGFEVEEEILNKNFNLQSTYLQIPHHGSKYSTSFSFLKAVKPALAIIQVGKNRYHHPHSELIRRLTLMKIPYHRTDLQGEFNIKI